MKKFSLLILLLLLSTVSIAYAQVKIGYMNPQKVLDELPQTVTIRQQMENFIQQKQQELIAKDQQVKDEYSVFLENAVNLSEVELQNEQQRLEGLRDELAQIQQNAETEVQQKRAELLSPVLQKMDEAVAKVAEQMGLDFVLNENTRAGDTILFYGQSSLNITDKVIAIVRNQ